MSSCASFSSPDSVSLKVSSLNNWATQSPYFPVRIDVDHTRHASINSPDTVPLHFARRLTPTLLFLPFIAEEEWKGGCGQKNMAEKWNATKEQKKIY